jgi:hypothetical protein
MKKSTIICWVLLGIALLMSCDNGEQVALSDGEVSGNIFQLDAVFGDDTNDCSAVAPCQTLARAQSVVQSGDVVLLAAGNYGEFNWELSGDFSDWITWQGIDAADRPVIDQVNLSCTQANCDAYQRFDTIEIRLPAGPWQYMNVVSSFGNSYVEFIDSEIHSEELYRAARAVVFQPNPGGLPRHLRITNSKVHNVTSGVHFKGSDIVVSDSEFYHMPGSPIGTLAGPLQPYSTNGAWDVTISGNHLYDHAGDYPQEPHYEHYDEPAELHCSAIAIRGHDFVIQGNEIHDFGDCIGIQFYADDVGGVYDIANITISNNFMYDMSNIIQSSGDIDGPIVVEHNTIISSRQDPFWTYTDDSCDRFINPALGNFSKLTFDLDLSATPDGGAGTLVRDNVFLLDFSIGNGTPYHEDYDDPRANWLAERNVIYRDGWRAGEMHPSNPILCATINTGQLPVDYIDQSLFVAPLYDYQHGENCGSEQACDFTPAPGSPLCTMGSNGSFVGAFACNP